MSDVRSRLLAAAALRTQSVRIGDEEFLVREVGADKFSEYGKLLEKDRHQAVAYLLADCVVGEDGNPALSIDDALEVARSARVGLPLLQGILSLAGYGEAPEKEPDAT
jgi:hypothetical protein